MPTPAPVNPPAEENLEAYRAAILAYRQSFKAEREKWGEKLMSYHIPKKADAEAVLRVSPGLTYAQAYDLAHQATCWAAQAHWKWFWKGVSSIAD
ncbi:MAG: hypothetical protein WBX25_34235 [Rhodomicrobium sp.]